MESVYGTPVSVSAKTPRRRRAMSPSTSKTPRSSFSSPYHVVDLNNETKESLKEKLQEAGDFIEGLKEERDLLHETMLNNSGFNESIIIEKSNKVSTQETRIYKRDVSDLREELRQNQKFVRQLQDQISHLERENSKLTEDLQKIKLKQTESDCEAENFRERITQLQKDLETKENDLTEMKNELFNQGQGFGDTQRLFETKIDTLEQQLGLANSKIEVERSEKKTQSEQLERLKIDFENVQQELDKHIKIAKAADGEIDKYIRKSLEAEQEQEDTQKKVLCEVQQLSNKIQCLTPLKRKSEAEEKERENYLQVSAKIIDENIKDLRRRNTRLEKELLEKSKLADVLKQELETLRKSMNELAGSSDQTSKFLQEENDKLTLQKADIRWELLEAKRELGHVAEKIKEYERTREDALKDVKRIKEEKRELEKELRVLEGKSTRNEEELEEMHAKLAGMESLKRQNESLKTDMSKLQERVTQMAKCMVMADTQCTHFKSMKETAERSRSRAIEQCNEMVVKIRNLETSLEGQRKIEQEFEMLKADKERNLKKIEFLNEEIKEIHVDYREELSRLAQEKISINQRQEIDSELVSGLKLSISQKESELRSAKKQIDEVKVDNQKLMEQLADVRQQQTKIVEENIKLRKGLADAVSKIEGYKRDCENSKELSEKLAEELGKKENKLSKLEEELNEKEQQVVESEQVVNYLHTQINTKPSKMPKLGRRSTLLSTVSESVLSDTSTIMKENEELEALETTKQELLRTLEQKRKMVENRTTTSMVNTTTQSITVTTTSNQSKSASQLSNPPKPGTMRHDIPHKWKEVRHMSVLSLKCAICFVGIPTFGKAKKCAHCDVQVHAACASRVFNTCGMPTQCANFYKENHTTVSFSANSEGRMNGWLRVYRDDLPGSNWISSWAMMDLTRISFYTNDGADLDKPFFTIDLNREQWVLRAGMEMPVECDDQMRGSNVLMIKMPRRSLFLLAPSLNSARRWSECLQIAQRKRMMLTSRPSSMAEYTCLLVLHSPNNLKIYKAHTFDDWIIFATQTGLFYTKVSQPRNPIRIAGPSSVTAMEVMPEINCLSMVTNSNGQLALIPLDSLQLAMQNTQPSIRPDILPEFQHVSVIKYHRQGQQRFLIAADSTNVHVLKYNAARDVYGHFAKIALKEPVICIESGDNGFFFASDTFYFVPLGNSQSVQAYPMVSPRDNDYPVSIQTIGKDEVFLAYQNYGIFVDLRGKATRREHVEWEQMPMEFVFTAPYLFVIHYDSIEVLEVAEHSGPDMKPILPDREVFECVNAHILGKQQDSVLISVSSENTTEVHRFNTSFNGKKNNVMKRRGLSPLNTLKRSKN